MAIAYRERYLQAVETHKGIIYKVAHLYCRNKTNLDDLVQEILIQIWLSFGSYDSSYKLSTWLYRVALNVAISFDRREKRHASMKAYQAQPEVDNDTDHPTDEKKIQLLHRIIKEFKEIDRAILLLYLDGYNHQEISEIIGLSVSNISTKMLRLKKKLKQRFNEIKKASWTN